MNRAALQGKNEAILRRWLRFNLAGAAGVAVQIGLLAALTSLSSLGIPVATLLAVESAVLHNFAWHEQWTWGDRSSSDPAALIRRLARFHLTSGLISITGNVALTSLLAGRFQVHPLIANIAAIAGCSIVNFFVCDQVVFRQCGSRQNESEIKKC